MMKRPITFALAVAGKAFDESAKVARLRQLQPG